jgi:hypothetical protein
MSVISALGSHPDEQLHAAAADYYQTHWLPPTIGDPAARSSYSVHGYSYLHERDIVYLIAGKVGAVLGRALSSSHFAYRIVNLMLFAGLVVVFVIREDSRPALTLLLVSPQIWYVFSYFNGDALPLAVSLLLAYETAAPESAFNRFLGAASWRANWPAALVVGLGLGVLMLAKLNYFIFLAALAAYLAWRELGLLTSLSLVAIVPIIPAHRFGFVQWSNHLVQGMVGIAVAIGVLWPLWTIRHDRARLRRIRRLATIGTIAIAVSLPRLVYDKVVVEGTGVPYSTTTQFAEEIASDEFKPSKSGTPEFYYGARLRDRGVPFHNVLFAPWNWLLLSAASAVGIYGYLDIRGPTWYYITIWLVIGAIAGVLAVRVWRSRVDGARTVFGLMALFTAGTGLLSALHSWVNDFQAQGRYLFPILPIVALLVLHSRERLDRRPYAPFVLGAFALSCLSFLWVALRLLPRA